MRLWRTSDTHPAITIEYKLRSIILRRLHILQSLIQKNQPGIGRPNKVSLGRTRSPRSLDSARRNSSHKANCVFSPFPVKMTLKGYSYPEVAFAGEGASIHHEGINLISISEDKCQKCRKKLDRINNLVVLNAKSGYIVLVSILMLLIYLF